MDQIDFDALRPEAVGQAFDHPFGPLMQEKCGVNEIDAEDTEGFALLGVLVIEHAYVQDDITRLCAGCSCSRTPTQPWHSLVCLKLRAVTVAA